MLSQQQFVANAHDFFVLVRQLLQEKKMWTHFKSIVFGSLE